LSRMGRGVSVFIVFVRAREGRRPAAGSSSIHKAARPRRKLAAIRHIGDTAHALSSKKRCTRIRQKVEC
jgi:hypothetical protein